MPFRPSVERINALVLDPVLPVGHNVLLLPGGASSRCHSLQLVLLRSGRVNERMPDSLSARCVRLSKWLPSSRSGSVITSFSYVITNGWCFEPVILLLPYILSWSDYQPIWREDHPDREPAGTTKDWGSGIRWPGAERTAVLRRRTSSSFIYATKWNGFPRSR